jgi:S-adenosyl-L-methionine hydrolase (adenosine-forming)
MRSVTLTSDWQNGDFYIGAVKGVIMAHCVDVQILDLSHQVSEFNSSQAAFVLRACYRYFPKGTIHIIAVNAESSAKQPFVLVKNDGQYFIGADNGMFGLLFDLKPEAVYELDAKYFPATYSSFPELTLFARVAAKLTKNENPLSFAAQRDDIFRHYPYLPVVDETSISGKVVYIDSYRNVIVNVTQDLFERVARGRKFDIFLQSKRYKISQISRTYNETSLGELVALFNSIGMLELAMNKGHIADILNLTRDSVIRIDFYD